MTTTDRDQRIRAALRPSPDLAVPADLADLIHDQLVATPQRRPSIGSTIRRRLPEPPVAARPAMAWAAILVLLGLALVAVLLVGTRREDGLPTAVVSYHGGPAQDGVMPGPGPAGVPEVLVDVPLPGPMDNFGLPLVRDGIVYVADLRGHVTAMSAVDLTTRWQTKGLEPGAHTPVLLGPRLVVASEDGTMVALDAATGTTLWTTATGLTIVASLAGEGDRVLVGSTDGWIVGLDAATGTEAYRVAAQGEVNRSPAIADGVVYAAADNGVITAFDLATGAVAWTFDLAADDPVPFPEPEVSTPIIVDGGLYLARGPFDTSSPHELVAFDLGSRTVRWRTPSPSDARLFVGAVVGDRVISVGEDGAIRAFDRMTGRPLDPAPLASAGDGIGALPTMVGGDLFVSSYDGVVRALDATTGVERWSVAVDGMPTMPIVIDGRVYVGTSKGRAVVLGDG